MYGSLKASRPISQRFCSTSERGWVVVRNMSSCLYLPTLACINEFYQRVKCSLQGGSNMLNIMSELGNLIPRSNVEYIRWSTPIRSNRKNTFYDDLCMWIKKTHDIESEAIKGTSFLPPLQYDTDGSGQIEFPEFCNMMSHKMNASDDKEAVRNVVIWGIMIFGRPA